MSSRVYRHRPWLAWSLVLLLLLALLLVPLVGRAARTPSIATVAGLLTALIPIGALAAFLVLGLRVRTVVDDEAITQHWITSTYRIPLADVTAVEWDDAGRRWFLRVRCGERTFEVIPCQLMGHAGGLTGPRPPRAMLAVAADLEERLAIDIGVPAR